MRVRLFGSAIAAVVTAALVLLLAPHLAGQESARGWNPPRTTDGQPDIQGFWTEEVGGPEAVNVETAMQTAESLRISGWTEERLKARKAISSIVDPPDGKIPYQPWAEARRQQILRRYGGDNITEKIQALRDVSPELVCIIGTPRSVFFADFQILQAPGVVVMAWERSGEYRIVPLNSKAPRLPDSIKLHMGDARGRWEGNTLVVETSNLNPGQKAHYGIKQRFYLPPTGKVTERFTRVSEKEVLYQFTVEDTAAYTQPWKGEVPLVSTQDMIYEYACHEGNYALPGILAGAREQEKKAK